MTKEDRVQEHIRLSKDIAQSFQYVQVRVKSKLIQVPKSSK